jgi:hypothetical protein
MLNILLRNLKGRETLEDLGINWRIAQDGVNWDSGVP